MIRRAVLIVLLNAFDPMKSRRVLALKGLCIYHKHLHDRACNFGVFKGFANNVHRVYYQFWVTSWLTSSSAAALAASRSGGGGVRK